MIITFLVQAIILVIDGLTFFLLPVTVLPFGFDAWLSEGIGYFKYLSIYIPTLAILYGGFIFIFDYKVLMYFLRFIRLIR